MHLFWAIQTLSKPQCQKISLLLKPVDKILTLFRTLPQMLPGLQHVHLTSLTARIDPLRIIQKLFKHFLLGQQRQFQINHTFAFAQGCEPFVWRHWICWWQWQWVQINPLTQCLSDRRFCLRNVWQHFFQKILPGFPWHVGDGKRPALQHVCSELWTQSVNVHAHNFCHFYFFACCQWISSRFGFGLWLCAFGPGPPP